MENLLMPTAAAVILNRSTSMVREYERQGILPAIRTSSGLRLFKERDVLALAEKLRAKDLTSTTGQEK